MVPDYKGLNRGIHITNRHSREDGNPLVFRRGGNSLERVLNNKKVQSTFAKAMMDKRLRKNIEQRRYYVDHLEANWYNLLFNPIKKEDTK
jgi:hypothetical protein